MGLELAGNRSGCELVSSLPTHPMHLVPLQEHADSLGGDPLLGSPSYVIFSSSAETFALLTLTPFVYRAIA